MNEQEMLQPITKLLENDDYEWKSQQMAHLNGVKKVENSKEKISVNFDETNVHEAI